MTSRRGFLGGVLASGLMPSLGWAAAGNPSFLNAARQPDGQYVLMGLDASGAELFRLPIPDRGHAATAHPTRPHAVAFARRPGTFAHVIDCSTGRVLHKLTSPDERHFYGHGAFSLDGLTLFTAENFYEEGTGIIGVWDVAGGYERIGEFPSGGVGPHELCRLPGTDILAICNGGIETHPDSGRAKLNIPTMEPNLAYVGGDGTLLEIVTLPSEMHKNSIRHMAVGQDGTVAFGMQWQAKTNAPPLVALHQRGQDLRLLTTPAEIHRRLKGYIGSVAMSENGQQVAVTSPRGGLVLIFDTQSGALIETREEPDVCGLGSAGNGFAISSGKGRFALLNDTAPTGAITHDVQFDNHLIPITA